MSSQLFKGFLIITLLGLTIYSFSWSNSFIWDDDHLIKDNRFIKNLNYLHLAFTRPLFQHAQEKSKFYRPLQEISYAFDYRIWGLNPFGFHFTNTFLHIACALLFSLILYQLFKNPFISFWGGAFFVVHPIHTEAIAYISGRADPLGTLFVLLALSCYINSTRGKLVLLPISLFSFSLALFSKESNLVFPFVILAYNFIFLKEKNLNRKLLPCLLFLVIDGLYLFMRLKLTTNDFLKFHQWAPPWSIRMITELKVVSRYILLLLFPHNLHMERFVPWSKSILDFSVISSLIFILLIIYLCIKCARQEKVIGFFSLFFIITLSPFLNVIPLNAQMAEHWLYLPSIGFFAIFAWAAFRFNCWLVPAPFHTTRIMSSVKWGLGKNFLPLVLTLILLIYSCLTIKQLHVWKDPLTFFEYNSRKAPYSSRIDICLASIYSKEERYSEAASLLKRVPRNTSEYLKARNNLAAILIELGNFDDARKELNIVLGLHPEYIQAYFHLANLYLEKGEEKKAEEVYHKMMTINPDFIFSYYSLGNLYCKNGKFKEAIDVYKKGIAIDKNFPDLHNNLGICYAELDYKEEAKREWEKALKLDPHCREAKYNLIKIDTNSHE